MACRIRADQTPLHLAPFFGAKRLDRIGRREVQAFVRHMGHTGLSTKTTFNALAVLHGIFVLALKDAMEILGAPCGRGSDSNRLAARLSRRRSRGPLLSVGERDDNFLIERTQFDDDAGRSKTERIVVRDGRVRRFRLPSCSSPTA